MKKKIETGWHFTKFEKTKIPNDRIFVNQSGVTIGRKVYEDLGKPKKINIYFDAKHKAIKLELAEDNGWTIFAYSGGVSYACVAKLYKVVPKGKYLRDNDGIFKLS